MFSFSLFLFLSTLLDQILYRSQLSRREICSASWWYWFRKIYQEVRRSDAECFILVCSWLGWRWTSSYFWTFHWLKWLSVNYFPYFRFAPFFLLLIDHSMVKKKEISRVTGVQNMSQICLMSVSQLFCPFFVNLIDFVIYFWGNPWFLKHQMHQYLPQSISVRSTFSNYYRLGFQIHRFHL